ncbi:deleted in malignant brain tumors 1 protein [Mytilus galloprovincialis]|uniref:Scavenger receptor cysteine-rich domain-containing protein DMBT1 n=1 Tax=Mytilus galloprovincialis TaxID=29158 RepID=A0A8B6D5Z1_MYTGA|nr:deleted in malignant brain tumors 1 protein [Mytilus galloprovincialis]
MSIRLSNGPSPSAGRVEINTWGTLCTSGMTDELATDLCKMIAAWPFTSHTTGKLMKNAYYGKGSGPIWRLRDGCHHDIAQCLSPITEHIDCNHDNDVGVFCLSNLTTRLAGGLHDNEGRVEMQYNNEWIGLCDTNWSWYDASAVCKSLGYWSTSATAYQQSWFGQSSNQLWFMRPACRTFDISFGMCDVYHEDYYGYHHCAQSNEAGVTCGSTNKDRNTVKLMNGPGPWKGDLMINMYYDGWGGICWKFWKTDANEVVCKTIGYRSLGQSSTSFRTNKKNYPIYLSDLNCTGSESNIGMCRGYYDVYNCSTDFVGIDCSGGIQVRLQNGTNPFEGRVEIFLGGEWKTLCDSSWNSYDSKAICSSLGVRTSTPVVLSNAYFGQGNTPKVISDLGCAGWEDHIGQCNIQESGSCMHTEDAGVRCVDCFEEVTTESGQITSKNYPSFFSDRKDCIFVIKPEKQISTNTAYILSIEDLRIQHFQDHRSIEIKEGIYGNALQHVRYFPPIDMVVGKEFFIRYTKENTKCNDRYRITWKALERQDAIKIGCGHASWDMAVNMTIMKKLYPDTIPELIYFPDASCTGVWRDDTIIFSHKYTGCGTQREDKVNSVLYKNRLMYPEYSSPKPIGIRHFRWTIDVECELSKIDSATANFHPNEILSTTASFHGGLGNVDHTSGSGKESVIIAFYKDQHPFVQNNIYPGFYIGANIYVNVKTQTTDNNYKMRLHSCVVKPQSYSSASYEYPLIKNG